VQDLMKLPGLHHLCLQVEDIDTCMSDLKRRGVRILIDTMPATPGTGTGTEKIAFIADPKGKPMSCCKPRCRSPHERSGMRGRRPKCLCAHPGEILPAAFQMRRRSSVSSLRAQRSNPDFLSWLRLASLRSHDNGGLHHPRRNNCPMKASPPAQNPQQQPRMILDDLAIHRASGFDHL
jgi:hypothetical protein